MRDIKLIEEELDKASDEYSEAFNKLPGGLSPYEFQEHMKPYSKKYHNLYREYRLTVVPEFIELEKYGDVMSLEKFKSACECGGFIDSDGFGLYVKDNMESNIEIYPSDFKYDATRKDFDTIIWFNK